MARIWRISDCFIGTNKGRLQDKRMERWRREEEEENFCRWRRMIAFSNSASVCFLWLFILSLFQIFERHCKYLPLSSHFFEFWLWNVTHVVFEPSHAYRTELANVLRCQTFVTTDRATSERCSKLQSTCSSEQSLRYDRTSESVHNIIGRCFVSPSFGIIDLAQRKSVDVSRWQIDQFETSTAWFRSDSNHSKENQQTEIGCR